MFDLGIVLFYKFYAHFVLVCDDYHQGRIGRKEFTTNLFRCLKTLQSSLEILIPFDGMNASNAVSRVIQEALEALATLKLFASQFIQQQKPTTPL